MGHRGVLARQCREKGPVWLLRAIDASEVADRVDVDGLLSELGVLREGLESVVRGVAVL